MTFCRDFARMVLPRRAANARGVAVPRQVRPDVKKSTTKPALVNPDQVTLLLDEEPAWWIYVLVDHRESDIKERVRYVGVTTQKPAKRMKGHIGEARRGGGKAYRLNWMRSLLSDGIKPQMEVIESGSAERDWARSEQKWIAHYRGLGCKLTNLTNGGEGTPGCWRSDEVRAKMSAAQKGKKASAEARAKMSAARTGKIRGRTRKPPGRRFLQHSKGRLHAHVPPSVWIVVVCLRQEHPTLQDARLAEAHG